MRSLVVIGHRGAAARVAENTLGSFRHACMAGADGVEFDLRMQDDEVIILHDDTVDRTTTGHGHYKSFSLAELRKLKTANAERIPLLKEALSEVRGCRLINLEIKEPGIVPLVIKQAGELCETFNIPQSAIVYSSFDVDTSNQLAELKGAARLGILFESDAAAALTRAMRDNAYSIHVALEQLDQAMIKHAQAKGLRVFVYTVNTQHDLEQCLRYGVDGVFSDDPGATMAIVANNFEAQR